MLPTKKDIATLPPKYIVNYVFRCAHRVLPLTTDSAIDETRNFAMERILELDSDDFNFTFAQPNESTEKEGVANATRSSFRSTKAINLAFRVLYIAKAITESNTPTDSKPLENLVDSAIRAVHAAFKALKQDADLPLSYVYELEAATASDFENLSRFAAIPNMRERVRLQANGIY